MKDQSTYTGQTSAAKLAVLANTAAKNAITVDAALDANSTNPVQNKVITAALASKASTATATQSSAGLMSAADKTKLDGLSGTGVTLEPMMDAEIQAVWDAN